MLCFLLACCGADTRARQKLTEPQACFTNSTEVLFGVVTLYNLRVIERLWGSRKFAVRDIPDPCSALLTIRQSFLLATLPYTTLLPPILLTFVLRPLTLGRLNYLPAGPVPLIFALLANYYAAIPYTYRYKLAPYASPPPTTSASPQNAAQTATSIWAKSITLTSKATTYLPPLQLALSQLPGSLLGAAVGWAVGTAYRRDVLPYASTWRVPGWVVGEENKRGFEGLRARLDAEREREGAGGALATGILAGETGAQARQRRTLGDMVAEQFRGRG